MPGMGGMPGMSMEALQQFMQASLGRWRRWGAARDPALSLWDQWEIY